MYIKHFVNLFTNKLIDKNASFIFILISVFFFVFFFESQFVLPGHMLFFFSFNKLDNFIKLS